MGKLLRAIMLGLLITPIAIGAGLLFRDGGQHFMILTILFPWAIRLSNEYPVSSVVTILALICLQFPLYAVTISSMVQKRGAVRVLTVLASVHIFAVVWAYSSDPLLSWRILLR